MFTFSLRQVTYNNGKRWSRHYHTRSSRSRIPFDSVPSYYCYRSKGWCPTLRYCRPRQQSRTRRWWRSGSGLDWLCGYSSCWESREWWRKAERTLNQHNIKYTGRAFGYPSSNFKAASKLTGTYSGHQLPTALLFSRSGNTICAFFELGIIIPPRTKRKFFILPYRHGRPEFLN